MARLNGSQLDNEFKIDEAGDVPAKASDVPAKAGGIKGVVSLLLGSSMSTCVCLGILKREGISTMGS